MALDFLPARKKESWYFIQHKLPLLYSLGVNKVIVGKVECAIHVDGLLLHKKDPSLLLAGHKCSTVFLPRQGEFRIRFPENPPLGLWVLAHSRGGISGLAAARRLRRGPLSPMRKGERMPKGERFSPFGNSLWQAETCWVGAFWRLVGLPLSHCDAVQKRAHRQGAPDLVRYPSGAGAS